jgi:hypothetical protein
MSQWRPGTSTHTALIPGRRRQRRSGFAVGVVAGLLIWVLLGLSYLGARELLG